VGVDEVTKARYAADLEANLQALSARLNRMGYRPQPQRRVYIPKLGRETGRPLGSSSCEDKIVELATKRGLEPLTGLNRQDHLHHILPIALDEVPIDHPSQQAVNMLIGGAPIDPL
jgi:retron-type reverse transcriptase